MEKLYQYLWKHRMFGRNMQSVDGEQIEILSPGILNTGAGPDFSSARIRIAGTEWAGNVEIHVRASDWFRHGHDSDSAYDTVMLHVVAVTDRRVQRPDGSTIPQVAVGFPESFLSMYSALSEEIADVRCRHQLSEVPEIVKEMWIESLGVERIQLKAERIMAEAERLGGDWESACFVTFARALGFGLNGEPFEQLARSIPLGYLRRHSDNLLQLEAIMFGQAGMLDTSQHIFDEYYQLLCREYFFLARKYGLRPLRIDMWKYSRTRPQNFPHRRIALLAKSLAGGFRLLSEIRAAGCDTQKLTKLFDIRLDGYWLTHSDFDREARCGSGVLGATSVDSMLINLAAPLIYAYGAAHGDPEGAEEGLDLWRRLPAENNMYIRNWKNCGLECGDAFRSQALLQLRKQYCDAGGCLKCRFGHALLRAKMEKS